MPTLANAPLIEVIFELRWGKEVIDPNSGVPGIQFTQEEQQLFPGEFKAIGKDKGFSYYENLNENIPNIPHLVKHRIRKDKGAWPCYQTGTGIFTANQVNDGYKWVNFRKDVLTGLEILAESFPEGLENIQPVYVELRYQDGFNLEKDEGNLDFLKKKLEFKFDIPEEFSGSEDIDGGVKSLNIGVDFKLTKPKGSLIIQVKSALINGEPGYVMETIVRSNKEFINVITYNSIENWLEEAHIIQKHTFKNLINRNFSETFQ